MLYVNFKDEGKIGVIAVCFKTEDAIDKLLDNSYGNILSVQAADYELDFIKEHFTNISMTDSRSVIWVGEEAKFIFENVRMVLLNQLLGE